MRLRHGQVRDSHLNRHRWRDARNRARRLLFLHALRVNPTRQELFPGLLLGGAVEGAIPFDHCPGIDPDNLPLREESFEDPDRFFVMGVVKDRNDDDGIADIEVCVTGRVPPAIPLDR